MINSDSNLNDVYARARDKVVDTCRTVETNIQGYSSTYTWMMMQYPKTEVPAWAEDHLKAAKEFEKAIAQFHRAGKPIPRDATEILAKCREVTRSLASRVDAIRFQELVQIDRPTVPGSQGLLTGTPAAGRIVPSGFEWQVNLGLMMNAYHRVQSPELKREIEFLVLNYLAKAAPITLDRLTELLDFPPKEVVKYRQLFQQGYFVEHGYHRERNSFDMLFDYYINKQNAQSTSTGAFFVTDRADISNLYSMNYHPLDIQRGKKELAKQMSQVILEHFRSHGASAWDSSVQRAFLFDLTNVLGRDLMTGGEKEKEAVFDAKKEAVKNVLSEAILLTIQEIKTADPSLFQKPQDEEKMVKFIKNNLLCVCRGEFKTMPFVKVIPFFPDRRDNFNEFVNWGGLRMGALEVRRKIFDILTLPELIERTNLQVAEYSVPGSQDAVYYPSLEKLKNSRLFTDFAAKMEQPDYVRDHLPMAILGGATAQLLDGLFKEIPPQQWDALNQVPDNLREAARNDFLAMRSVLQASLFRLMQQLAKANHHSDDFTKFTEAIELVHCEISNLLELIRPFKANDFPVIYKNELTSIPEELKPLITAGLTKTAMNTFAGIVTAARENNPDTQIAHGTDSYFETAYVVGKNRSIREATANPLIPQVDLYVGEFNHNINIREGFHHYTPGNIIADVEKLMAEKPTKHLTIAVDSTVDLLNSPKAKELLERFKEEIKEGKLNFIFFRSGQKFDMLGMDNYYGSPFYMINNGGPQWKAFQRLNQDEVFKTDPLSYQWFCLVNKYAAKKVDDYRTQYFKNARALLDKVPPFLNLPESAVRVSTVDPKMDPAFIDIKIIDDGLISRHIIERILYQKMMAAGRKAHSRGSFGFYHPNFNFIDNVTLRINPGLDPKDNQIILEVLEEIARMKLVVRPRDVTT
jgi:hypothetical protein